MSVSFSRDPRSRFWGIDCGYQQRQYKINVNRSLFFWRQIPDLLIDFAILLSCHEIMEKQPECYISRSKTPTYPLLVGQLEIVGEHDWSRILWFTWQWWGICLYLVVSWPKKPGLYDAVEWNVQTVAEPKSTADHRHRDFIFLPSIVSFLYSPSAGFLSFSSFHFHWLRHRPWKRRVHPHEWTNHFPWWLPNH